MLHRSRLQKHSNKHKVRSLVFYLLAFTISFPSDDGGQNIQLNQSSYHGEQLLSTKWYNGLLWFVCLISKHFQVLVVVVATSCALPFPMSIFMASLWITRETDIPPAWQNCHINGSDGKVWKEQAGFALPSIRMFFSKQHICGNILLGNRASRRAVRFCKNKC